MKWKVVIATLLLSVSTQAQSNIVLPVNNTRTRLESYEDLGAKIEGAYIYHHLYGDDVIISLEVPNLSPEKEIWLYRQDATPRTSRVLWVKDDAAFRSGGEWAVWNGDSDGKTKIILKITSIALINSWNSTVNNPPLEIYIKTGGQQFAAKNIRIKID